LIISGYNQKKLRSEVIKNLEKHMKLFFLMALMTVSGAVNAGVVTIDFENTLPTYFGLASYQEDGFTLTSNVPDGTLIDVNNVVRGNFGIFSGGTSSQSLFWGENGTNSIISLAGDGGEVFELLSLDASSLYDLSSGQLTLTGMLSGGGSVQQVLNLNGALTTYNITGMTGLSALNISFDGATYDAPYDLDNIQMNVVPLPAGIWLMGSALAGLAGWQRRRKATI
jgi:hypothetical protein